MKHVYPSEGIKSIESGSFSDVKNVLDLFSCDWF